MPYFAESEQGLHCLPSTLLGVSRLQWITKLNCVWVCVCVCVCACVCVGGVCLCVENDELTVNYKCMYCFRRLFEMQTVCI